MPQDGLFFRIVRRLFLLFGTLISLAILALGGYAGWNFYKTGYLLPTEPIPPLALPTTELTSPTYHIHLAPFESHTSTPDISAPESTDNRLYVLNRESLMPGVDYPVESEVTNLMLIDLKTGGGKWLFKGTNRNIFARHCVRQGKLDSNAAVDKRPIVGLVLMVDEKNINAGADEVTSVYYWRLDRPDAVKLLEGVKGIAHGQLETGYNIVYKKGSKTISVMYSIPDFKVISQTTLPEP